MDRDEPVDSCRRDEAGPAPSPLAWISRALLVTSPVLGPAPHSPCCVGWVVLIARIFLSASGSASGSCRRLVGPCHGGKRLYASGLCRRLRVRQASGSTLSPMTPVPRKRAVELAERSWGTWVNNTFPRRTAPPPRLARHLPRYMGVRRRSRKRSESSSVFARRTKLLPGTAQQSGGGGSRAERARRRGCPETAGAASRELRASRGANSAFRGCTAPPPRFARHLP
jgi:hypothetical protein